MLKKNVILLSFLLCAGIVFNTSAQVKTGEEKDKESKEKAKKDSVSATKKTSYEKLLKKPQRQAKGMMSLYYVKEKLYLEIPVKLLGRDMLLASTISETSDNLYGIVGSKPQNPLQVTFIKVDSTILLNKIIKNTIAPEDDINLNNALAKNSIGAIMEKFDIAAYNEDKTVVVIDVTNYFLGDIKELSPFGAFRMNVGGTIKGTESFKKDRSYIGEIKAFEDNISIKSHLSYESTISSAKTVYQKDKPFTTVMTRSLLLLPEKPERPRIADPRIGIFVSNKNQLSNRINKTEDIYYAHRWNLAPKDVAAYKRGELVEPVKPITFYVDNDFPTAWRVYIKEAITDWNATFEAIGYKNAIVALDYPTNDPGFDPDNLKYNCVRYAPTPVANAVGPSWVDPRTGEIINASVYVFHDIVKLLNNWMFIQISPTDKNVRSVELPEAYKFDGIKYVVRHEIGHCLGFMHNFAGSSSIPVDSLRSPSFTQKYGTTYSIMDYARFNYVAQPGDMERGVKLAPPQFGLYDYYLVKWNYTYIDPVANSPVQQEQLLEKIITDKAADVRYRYGMQGQSIDPSIQSEDLGDDGVKASVYGVNNLKYIMKNLNGWVAKQDKDYAYRKDIWEGIIDQYVTYVNHVLTMVGGFYINEKYEGDPRPSFQTVPRDKQVAAIKFLLNNVEDLDWLEDKTVLENMTLAGTPAVLIRGQIIEALLQSPLSVNLSSLRSKEKSPLTPKEVIGLVYDGVWSSAENNKKPTEAQKDMQKAYVNATIKGAKLIVPGKPGGFAITGSNAVHNIAGPDFIKKQAGFCEDATANNTTNPISAFRSMSVNFNLQPSLESFYYEDLVKVRKLLKKAAGRASDRETQAHYKYLLNQVDKVLQ